MSIEIANTSYTSIIQYVICNLFKRFSYQFQKENKFVMRHLQENNMSNIEILLKL